MIRSARSSIFCTRVVMVVAILTLVACGTTESETRSAGSEPRAAGSDPRPPDRALDRRWVAPGPSDPHAIAADDRGSVAIGRYGAIVALDREGHEEWASTVTAHGEQTLGPVALGQDLTVLPVTPGRLVALDRATGEARWSVATPDPAVAAVGSGSDSGAAVAVLSFDGLLGVFEGRDGAPRWSTQLAFGERGAPVSVEIRSRWVVAAWADVGGSHVQVFDGISGQPQWATVASLFAGAPAVTSDSVVVSENLEQDGRHVTARVRRLALANGAEQWVRHLDGPFLPQHRPVVDKDVAVVVDFAGTLTVLDLETGSLRWRQRTGRKQYAASPVLFGRSVAMTTYGTGLVAVDAASGAAVRNDAPGAMQAAVTFEGSAASGRSLYLLAGRSQGQGEVWMLSASA